MTRVLHLLGGTAGAGAENQARYLLGALRRESGIQLELAFFRRGEMHEAFLDLGLPMHDLGAGRSLSVDLPRRTRALRRLFSTNPPDILHTWLYEAHQVGLLAARGHPSTKVVIAHRSSTIYTGTRKHLWALRLQRRRIDHVIANSRKGAQMITDALALEPGRVSIVANGIPTDRVSPGQSREAARAALGVSPVVPLICVVGRPDPTKDFPLLFAALERVRAARPDTELVVIGATEAELAEKGWHPPPRTFALGWQSRPTDIMSAADVIAISSRTEGYSNVACEALTLGLPVATTDVGDHPSLVRNAGGRVVPAGCADLLARALLELLDSAPRPEEVRTAARRRLSIDRAAVETLAVYRRVLSSRSNTN